MSTPTPEHPGLAGLAARESMSAQIARAADDDSDHVPSHFSESRELLAAMLRRQSRTDPAEERRLTRQALARCGCCGHCDCQCHAGGEPG